MPPKKKAKVGAKGKAKAADCSVLWEWKDDDGDWNEFDDLDKVLLENRYEENPDDVFLTTDFTFNKEHTTVYEIDFQFMTQTNKSTAVCRSIRRDEVSPPNPSAAAKKKKGKGGKKKTPNNTKSWYWMDDDEEWKAFGKVDADMLETKYLEGGPKSKFTTKDFSFNKKHKTNYVVDFKEMVQINKSSNNERKIRRGEAVDDAEVTKVKWQWWKAEDSEWESYDPKDAALLETAYLGGGTIFLTKDLTFNKGHDSQYIFDFKVMTQMNADSSTSRKIHRAVDGAAKGEADEDEDGEDSGYACVLASGFGSGGKSGLSTSKKGSVTSFEFKAALSKGFVDGQKAKGAQSKRGGQDTDYGPAVKMDKHGTECFDEMLKNEQTFAGEWAVFYHSYSAAALLYEVQAAAAAVLFRFKSQYAVLPRLLYKPFEHIHNAERMQEEFPKWGDRDHNPAFRGVGICATSSLLAGDSEAPPKNVFLMGYSVGPLHGLLERLLKECGIPSSKTKSLATKIVSLANKHGLDACAYGGKPCKSGRAGHMLQIFVRRELCDEFIYPSFAFGVPDKARDKPLSKYLAQDVKIAGQVRITANPDVFIRATCVRMFVFSADKNFHANRQDFQEELTSVLEPILGDATTRTEAAKGIFGGNLPSWWTPEDQGSAAAMPMSRYAASAL